MTAESELLAKDNVEIIKLNEKTEAENTTLQETIMTLIQRIDTSTLLREIDIEEMRHQANQNVRMNEAFEDLIDKFASIKKQRNDI